MSRAIEFIIPQCLSDQRFWTSKLLPTFAAVMALIVGRQIVDGSPLVWMLLIGIVLTVLIFAVPIDQLLVLVIVVGFIGVSNVVPHFYKLPGADVWLWPVEVGLVVVIPAWLLFLWWKHNVGPWFTGINKLILLMMGTAMVAAFIGILRGNNVQDVTIEFRLLLPYLFGPVVTTIVLWKQPLRVICITILVGAVVSSLLFFVALTLSPQILRGFESFEQIYRFRIGIVRQSVFVIPLALQIGFFSNIKRSVKWLARFSLMLQSVLAILSISRGRWIGLSLALCLIIFLNLSEQSYGHRAAKVGRIVSLLAFLVIATVVFLTVLPVMLGQHSAPFFETVQERTFEALSSEGPDSMWVRVEATQRGFRVFLSRPVFGHGLGTETTSVTLGYRVDPERAALRVDNFWIWSLIKGGVIWTAVWMALLVVAPLRAYHVLRKLDRIETDSYTRSLLITALVSGTVTFVKVAFALSNQIIENLMYITLLAILWGAVEGLALMHSAKSCEFELGYSSQHDTRGRI